MSTQVRNRPTMAPALRLAAAVIVLAGPAPVSAQPDVRGFVSVNGGLQAATGSFSQDVVFAESGGVYRDVLSGAAAHEQASFDTSYVFRTGMLFDASGGVHVGRYFGFGIGVSRFGSTDAVRVAAQVPHPLFFDRDRSITGSSSPLTRTETAIHLQARVMIPATASFVVTVFGGPTVFNVVQQLVTDVRFTHEYPYETASFSSAMHTRESGSTTGFNVGGDVAYYFSSNVGVGWLVRYSRATLELPSAGDGSLDVRTGGLHAAGGLRLRF